MHEKIRIRLKKYLSDKLIKEGCFWSYDMKNMNIIPDDMLIYKALVHLDIDDLHLLFNVFSKKKIKKIWREQLVIQGKYYYNMNRFYAWFYFDVKNPDKYIKTIISKHLNSFA